MAVDQPTFQDCSLTMVTGRGSNEATDFTTASGPASRFHFDSVAHDQSNIAVNLPENPRQAREEEEEEEKNAKDANGATVDRPRVIMDTSVIMDKFLHSFKVPAVPASAPPPRASSVAESFVHSAADVTAAAMKSLASEAALAASGCSMEDSFISVTPFSEALDDSSASKASSYATCIQCERTAVE